MSEQFPYRPEYVAEKYIRGLLVEIYKPEGIDIWLNSPHKLLKGRRPIDLIQVGRTAEVLRLVDQFRSGAFV